jgi:hypothetical protein
MKREPELFDYCEHFIRVLKAGFGDDRAVSATIFHDSQDSRMPVRMVAIHLDLPREELVIIEDIDSSELCQRLTELDAKLLQAMPDRGGVFFQRVARIYDEVKHGRRVIPTIYIVKPDRIRYWTRSAAMRDADEVAADILQWAESRSAEKARRKPK